MNATPTPASVSASQTPAVDPLGRVCVERTVRATKVVRPAEPIRAGIASMILLLVAFHAQPASAMWRNLELVGAAEGGYVWFDDLANYVGYQPSQPIDQPLPLRYTLADGSITGFRLGLAVHSQLEILWSRLWSSSRARVFADGQELVSNPDAVPAVLLPDVDVRIDMITLGYRIAQLEYFHVAPVVRLGYGWVLTSQSEDIVLPGRVPANYSDSDKALEASLGLTWRWKAMELGAEFRSFHWRWDPEDALIPARNTRAWMASGWGAVRF
jgi:hypothetical protein